MKFRVPLLVDDWRAALSRVAQVVTPGGAVRSQGAAPAAAPPQNPDGDRHRNRGAQVSLSFLSSAAFSTSTFAKMQLADQRSIRFDIYKGQTVLEITGNYYAAYSADRMDSYARLKETFQQVVMPMLQVEVPALSR